MTKKVRLNSQQIIQLKQNGTNQKAMADIFGVSQQTITRWKKQKNSAPQERKRKPKDYGNIPKLLKHCISKNIETKQWEMAEYVSKETGQSISQQTISRILRKHKITYHYTQLDEEKAKAFNGEIKPSLETNPFIAIDECSFYPNLNPRFGYSLKGERAISKRPGHKGKHYTLLFAIGNLKEKGVIHWKLTDKRVNWKVFYDFLEEIKPIGNKRNYLIMDNAKIHTAPDKRKEAGVPKVEEQMLRKNIEIRFITRYAPMLNPAELCFNFLRQKTESSRSRNYEGMKLAIEEAVKLLNEENLSKWFWHCVEYFDKKEKKVKIPYNGKGKRKGLLPKKKRSIK